MMGKVRCIKCNKVMDNNQNICPHCGATYEYLEDIAKMNTDYDPSVDAVNYANSQPTYKVSKEDDYNLPIQIISKRAYEVSSILYGLGLFFFWISVVISAFLVIAGISALFDDGINTISLGVAWYLYILFVLPILLNAFIVRCVFHWMAYMLQTNIIIANKK